LGNPKLSSITEFRYTAVITRTASEGKGNHYFTRKLNQESTLPHAALVTTLVAGCFIKHNCYT
jgi:hypothetical protein